MMIKVKKTFTLRPNEREMQVITQLLDAVNTYGRSLSDSRVSVVLEEIHDLLDQYGDEICDMAHDLVGDS